MISVQGYLEAVVRMLLGFGLCFQLPVVTWFLARIGLIDHRDLIKGFRYAVVGIFVVAAIVTPTPDVLTQALLALPLIVLYVLGIGVAWRGCGVRSGGEGSPRHLHEHRLMG